MSRRSGVVFALASVPFLTGLLLLPGCSTDFGASGSETAEERNESLKGSADYMRQQYQNKQQKKR